jgi:hypothetical protein
MQIVFLNFQIAIKKIFYRIKIRLKLLFCLCRILQPSNLYWAIINQTVTVHFVLLKMYASTLQLKNLLQRIVVVEGSDTTGVDSSN